MLLCKIYTAVKASPSCYGFFPSYYEPNSLNTVCKAEKDTERLKQWEQMCIFIQSAKESPIIFPAKPPPTEMSAKH